MWDSETLSQLVKAMPKKLSKENIERLQMIIEADKYKNSLISGFELCGMYAPFCLNCNRSHLYPCAFSYLNMLKSEGADFEIDYSVFGADAAQAEPTKEVAEETAHAEAVTVPQKEVTAPVQDKLEETPVIEEAKAVPSEQPVVDNPPSQAGKLLAETEGRKIRIAVARKKI